MQPVPHRDRTRAEGRVVAEPLPVLVEVGLELLDLIFSAEAEEELQQAEELLVAGAVSRVPPTERR